MAIQQNANTNTPATPDREKTRKPVKKNKRRSPSFLADSSSKSSDNQRSTVYQHCQSPPLSMSAEFANGTLKKSLLDKEDDSLSTKSRVAISLTQVAEYPAEGESSILSQRVRHDDQGISWKWLKARKGVRARKLISPIGRRSTDGMNKRQTLRGRNSQGRASSPEERDMINEITPVCERINTGSSFNSDCSTSHNHQDRGKSKMKDQCQSSISLSSKYQPKLFEDIAGHEVIIKAISNAVQKEKIAPLYLFHGTGGTGKTSTARILSMALNCESTTHTKPCWSCKGCTRSLYIMDLCSGSRISGFERIRTLLQSTTFTQIVTGFKVFIIEECHSLTVEAWEEILNIVERSSGSPVVFVMITEDVNMVPKNISSRCQKFCFPKLKDMDIILKLARIVSREEIEIERDALRLIISKADGSMREAENILDQLALLGSKITSPMVQQIVGLVPYNKLLDLLTTVLFADTIKTVRCTRELIVSGVQPKSILSQLASLITDILSGASATTTSQAGSSKDKRLSRTGSQLSDDQSERLSHALKTLVETEKQLSSSNDQTNWVVSALLQIASGHNSSRAASGIVLPRDITVPSDYKFDVESRQNSTNAHRNKMPEVLPRGRSRKCQQAIDNVLESDITATDICSLIRSVSKTKRSSSRTFEKEPVLGNIGNMEEVWQNMLERVESEYVKEFLSQQGKIASLTISSANVILHIMFKRPEDKVAAQMSEETIESALKTAFGCPVTINMSLEPIHMETNERTSSSTAKGKETECGNCRHHQSSSPFLPLSESPGSRNAAVVLRHNGSRRSSATSDTLRTMRLQGITQMSEHQDNHPSEKQEASTTRPQQVLPFSGSLMQENDAAFIGPENDPSAREQIPLTKTQKKKAANVKHRWLSLSSIQQGDASVERYSQDLLFENENTDRERGKNRHSKLHKIFLKDNNEQQCQDYATPMGLNRSWSCSEVFCRRR